MITLFPDQVEFESDIRSAYAADAASVLGVAPTGFGKTIVFSDLAARAQAKGKSVGIFAHRAELIDQIGTALGKFGVQHGYLAPGFAPNPLASVQVCSIQAVARRVERLMARPFDLCVLDEAHHAAEGTSAHAIVNAHLRKAKRVLGVTATPQRLSGEPLSIAFDKMVIGPSVASLIAIGRLSKFRMFAPSRPDLSNVSRRAGDFRRDELGEVMDKPTITGDAVAHYRRICDGRRALAFCVSIAHAEHVAEQFRAAGYASASLDGKMDRATRRRVLADFASGRVQVLTSCDIVSEGFDVPAIEVAILLRPTESLALYLQQVGRSLRPYPGKDHALILDHAGNSLDKKQGGRGHGFPDDPREWTLSGGRPNTAGMAQRSDRTIVCGRCWGMFRPAPCCPYCGFERDIQGRVISEIEGELEEIDPNLVREARRLEQDRINRRVQQTRDLAGLASLAVELGYKDAWLHRIYTSRGHPKFTLAQAYAAMRKAREAAKESA